MDHSTQTVPLEETARANLLRCADAYVSTRNIKLTTLGRIVANDSPFFARLNESGRTFTLKKYDEIMSWFSAQWPEGAAWPDSVPRPNAPRTLAPDNTASHDAVSSQHPIPEIARSPQPGTAPEQSVEQQSARGGVELSSSDPQFAAPSGVDRS